MTALEGSRTLPPTPSEVPVASHTPRPARLRVRANDHHDFVDGGWWLQSTDLTVELPSLIAATPSAGSAVARMVYRVSAWVDAPRKMPMASGSVRLASYGRSHDARAVAESALQWPGLDRDQHSANEILACARRDASPPIVAVTSGNRSAVAPARTDGGRVLAS